MSNKTQPLQHGASPPTDARNDFLPFTRPTIDAADIAAVVQVLESGWITSGAKVRQLEQQMKDLTGCEHAVAICSATAGMHLVLHALGIGPGDEVITPSLTWVSTVNLITLAGATPVYVDIDRDTLMTTAERVEKAITPRTRLIIPVHYAGAPLDLDPLRQVAARHGIPMVEDAAHALGSRYRDHHVGHTGTAIFSFQAIKNVTTAEGGVVCTDDPILGDRLRRLRFHGLGADAFDRKTEGRLPNAEVIEPGFKYNLPDMNACLGLGQLDRLSDIVARRAKLASAYQLAFEKIDAISPLGLPDYPFEHGWHLYIVRLETDPLTLSRDSLMSELKAMNIGTGIHFKAAHQHLYYRERPTVTSGSLENTNWNSDRILSLPLFPDMQASDVDRVVAGIDDIIARFSK